LRRDDIGEPASGFLLLKVGHHGSDTSTSAALLARLQPDVGVVSVGKSNRYGHPAATTLHALDAMSCIVLRTDLGGAIRIVLRGTTLWIERPDVPARFAGSLVHPG
jgi:competence protein ComEC